MPLVAKGNTMQKKKERLPWLDQWIVPVKGSPLAKLSAIVRRVIVENEVRHRARKADDETRFKIMVDVITANLAKVHLEGNDGLRILVGDKVMGSHSRYDNPAIGIPFKWATEVLSRPAGLIGYFVSIWRGTASSIHPAQELIDMMTDLGVTAAHLTKLTNSQGHAAEEIVLLREKDKGVGWMAGQRATLWERRWAIDYRDTKETMSIRSTVKDINARLSKADITYTGPEPVAVNLRTLHRAFTTTDGVIRWDLGGRLFGGFWLNMPKTLRHWLRIEGEPVISVDFRATMPQLALVSQGYEPAKGDPYAIPDFPEVERGVVKMAVSALLCARSTGVAIEGIEDMAKFKDALIHHHPGLSGTLGKGLGHRLMNTESRILIEALRLLAKQGVVALPLHDCVMVKMSKAPTAGEAMLDAAESITGHRLPVTISHPSPPIPSTPLPIEGGIGGGWMEVAA
jgi:hypothetical protein